MAEDTRTHLLNAAESLFADKGFYGASIAAIADELGLTKQALLHHFGSKERLYGAVLQRISADYERQLSDLEETDRGPKDLVVDYFLSLYAEHRRNETRVTLLMRELLDNKQRAETASAWYLRDYLKKLTDLVRAVPGWEEQPNARAFALVYQLLGALNYFAISRPTLARILEADEFDRVQNAFAGQFEALLNAALSSPGARHQS